MEGIEHSGYAVATIKQIFDLKTVNSRKIFKSGDHNAGAEQTHMGEKYVWRFKLNF